MMTRSNLSLLIICGMLGCLAARPTLPPDENRLKPGDAPTPYSAGEIRGALPEGSWIRFTREVAGGPEVVVEFRFGNSSDEEAALEVATLDEAGNAMAEPKRSRPAWKELQSHASFSQGKTAITRTARDTFKGRLDCWLYEVRDGETLTKYWFAETLPGPPVFLEEYKGGALQLKMTMVGRGVGEIR